MTDRRDAYLRKLYVLASELDGCPHDPDLLNDWEVKGVLHAVQVSVDAAMDLAAMAVKDHGREVVDDYHNLHTLADLDVIDKDLAGRLADLNGLRNAIVHKYNRFEERTVFENLERIRGDLAAFAEQMEATL